MAMSHAAWTPHATLRCAACQSRFAMGPLWSGCLACPTPRPLLVDYDPSAITVPPPTASLADRVRAVAQGIWPIIDRSTWLAALGAGTRPLVPLTDPSIHIKAEYVGPSGSHKDRFHALSTEIALMLGATDVVTASTGNHGAACAAFAARAGLGCLVLLHPDSPQALRTQLRSYGARIAIVPGHVPNIICALVDRGWFPGTAVDPSLTGRGNPFGADAYRHIAFEIVNELGHVPPVVAVPAASGDTLYGISRGFRDLHELAGLPMPFMLGVQPEGAAPLVVTQDNAADHATTVPYPKTSALSTADERSGWHASLALHDHGYAIAVTEEAIASGLAELASSGQFVEPASAVSLAGLNEARRHGVVSTSAEAVCIATSSGQNWTEHIDRIAGPPPITTDPDELLSQLTPGLATGQQAFG